jgi:hypothetical protein
MVFCNGLRHKREEFHALEENVIKVRIFFQLVLTSKILDLSLPVDEFPCDLVGILNNGRFSIIAEGIPLQIGRGHDDKKLQPGDENIIWFHFMHVRESRAKSNHIYLDFYADTVLKRSIGEPSCF